MVALTAVGSVRSDLTQTCTQEMLVAKAWRYLWTIFSLRNNGCVKMGGGSRTIRPAPRLSLILLSHHDLWWITWRLWNQSITLLVYVWATYVSSFINSFLSGAVKSSWILFCRWEMTHFLDFHQLEDGTSSRIRTSVSPDLPKVTLKHRLCNYSSCESKTLHVCVWRLSYVRWRVLPKL